MLAGDRGRRNNNRWTWITESAGEPVNVTLSSGLFVIRHAIANRPTGRPAPPGRAFRLVAERGTDGPIMGSMLWGLRSDQGQPPRALAPAAVFEWTTLILVGGTYPDRTGEISCGSTFTSQVRTMAALLVRPVAGCLVPGGFLNGRRTWSAVNTGGTWLVTGAATIGKPAAKAVSGVSTTTRRSFGFCPFESKTLLTKMISAYRTENGAPAAPALLILVRLCPGGRGLVIV
jgi:hypothetical protein